MITLLIYACALLAIICVTLALLDVTDQHLSTHRPGWDAGWARVFGETDPPRPLSHVSVSPLLCGACGAPGGWHDPGCGWLDRADAGRPR